MLYNVNKGILPKKKKKSEGNKLLDTMRNRKRGVTMTLEESDEYIDHICDIPELSPFRSFSARGPQGKKGIYDGQKFDSVWEYAFYRYCKELKGYLIERNTTDFFVYTDENGKPRKFFYDFRVNGLPIEIKGILRPTDECKRAQCPNVQFLFGEDIKPIIKELNQKIPHWRDDYLARN